MRFSLDRPQKLTTADIHTINEIASVGFGFDNPDDMLEDTLAHIHSADLVQRTIDGKETVGFALYQRSLWQAGD